MQGNWVHYMQIGQISIYWVIVCNYWEKIILYYGKAQVKKYVSINIINTGLGEYALITLISTINVQLAWGKV